jgi:hypothetical protein
MTIFLSSSSGVECVCESKIIIAGYYLWVPWRLRLYPNDHPYASPMSESSNPIPEEPPEPLSISIDLQPVEDLVPEHDPSPGIIAVDLLNAQDILPPSRISEAVPTPSLISGTAPPPIPPKSGYSLLPVLPPEPGPSRRPMIPMSTSGKPEDLSVQLPASQTPPSPIPSSLDRLPPTLIPGVILTQIPPLPSTWYKFDRPPPAQSTKSALSTPYPSKLPVTPDDEANTSAKAPAMSASESGTQQRLRTREFDPSPDTAPPSYSEAVLGREPVDIPSRTQFPFPFTVRKVPPSPDTSEPVPPALHPSHPSASPFLEPSILSTSPSLLANMPKNEVSSDTTSSSLGPHHQHLDPEFTMGVCKYTSGKHVEISTAHAISRQRSAL